MSRDFWKKLKQRDKMYPFLPYQTLSEAYPRKTISVAPNDSNNRPGNTWRFIKHLLYPISMLLCGWLVIVILNAIAKGHILQQMNMNTHVISSNLAVLYLVILVAVALLAEFVVFMGWFKPALVRRLQELIGCLCIVPIVFYAGSGDIAASVLVMILSALLAALLDKTIRQETICGLKAILRRT